MMNRGSASPPESLAMEMIANNLFNDRDDNGDLLGRYRLLWMTYGARNAKFIPRRAPATCCRRLPGSALTS